mmetsp:Transcript_15216/g.22623  ORF Transcript_15216/g.22623 Transcript_15216/m.22623 type:complete len:80 (-) Transcript_15216:1275-1514(-)
MLKGWGRPMYFYISVEILHFVLYGNNKGNKIGNIYFILFWSRKSIGKEKHLRDSIGKALKSLKPAIFGDFKIGRTESLF